MTIKYCNICKLAIPFNQKLGKRNESRKYCSKKCYGEAISSALDLKSPYRGISHPTKKHRVIPYHRKLMQDKIGRELTRNEVVHHINENKRDNRLENLQIMDRGEHTVLHCKIYPDTSICKICFKEFKTSPKQKHVKTCSRPCKLRLQFELKVANRKFNEPEISNIRKMYSAGNSARVVGEKFGASAMAIYYVVHKLNAYKET